MTGAQPTLIVLRALGLGDFLTAVPAYRALARAFPCHRRVLVAPAALAPLAALTRCFDDLLPRRPLEPLPADLPPPDVGVNLHGAGPESHRLLLATRPRRLIAFAHPLVPESGGMPVWRDGEHDVARWCRLLRGAGLDAHPRDLDLPPPAAAGVSAAGATLMHPGAASMARRWPASRWAELIRIEQSHGHRVILTGGAAEASLVQRIARAAGVPAHRTHAGRTTLAQLAALVASAGRVVCGDTGVAHLATAFGVPSVLLFGPTSPAAWGPPVDRPWHRVLWAGEIGDPHGRRPDPGLLRIRVLDVVLALATLPQGRGRSPGERGAA